jgi:hypothetical protein
MTTLTVVVKKPGEAATIAQMEAGGDAMNALIGGHIQFLPGHAVGLPDGLDFYCNEDGGRLGLAANMILFDGQDVCVGNVLIAGRSDCDNRSLTEAESLEALAWCEDRAL